MPWYKSDFLKGGINLNLHFNNKFVKYSMLETFLGGYKCETTP